MKDVGVIFGVTFESIMAALGIMILLEPSFPDYVCWGAMCLAIAYFAREVRNYIARTEYKE